MSLLAAGATSDAGKPVLILGGTAEARELAALLVEVGVPVTSSLAGRVARPRLPVGDVRIGGFGGVDGLARYLRERGIGLVVDATHPFAQGMSRNAVAAVALVGTPLLRLERPGWEASPQARQWCWVDSHDEAAAVTARLGHRPFLTVGRQSLDRFTGPLVDADALVRVVDPPDISLPARWTLLTSRGPYTADAERALMVAHGCDVVVTKNSGGSFTWAKLQVADELGLHVVVVRRTAYPAVVQTMSAAADAAAWVLAR